MFGHRVGIFRTSNTKSVMIRFGRASEICSPRTQPTAHASLIPICDSHHKSLSFGFKPVPQLEAFQKPNFFRRTCRSAVCYKFNSRLLLASFFSLYCLLTYELCNSSFPGGMYYVVLARFVA